MWISTFMSTLHQCKAYEIDTTYDHSIGTEIVVLLAERRHE